MRIESEEETGRPSVSVIIPTTLRKELPRAISSVERQSLGRASIEIVVVVDRACEDVTGPDQELLKGADVVLFSGGKRDGGYCRKIGTEAATGDWVAYLDDDDEFLPDKLSRQLEAASTAGPRCVISSRVVEVSQSGKETCPLPKRVYVRGRVEEYLFKSRGPFVGRASIFTSTLLVPALFAKEISWRRGLVRHQDWDWLYRAQNGGAEITQLDRPLVRIAVASLNSISRSSRWKESLEWSSEYSDRWDKKTSVDFILGQPLRYALQARSATGVLACVGAVVRLRAIPSFRSLALGLAGAAPRRLQESVFFSLRGLRRFRA